MTDELDLSRLTTEQRRVLNTTQLAAFAMLEPKDQVFFSRNFSVNDLPRALDRKAELLKQKKESYERMLSLQEKFQATAKKVNEYIAEDVSVGDLMKMAAGAAGIGAAAAIASGGSGRWLGVSPADLVAPLTNEFGGGNQTSIDFDGSDQALEGTIYLTSAKGYVPALTVNLTRIQEGLEAKVSDLTSRGALETLRSGGKHLLALIGRGLQLWGKGKFGKLSPGALTSAANDILENGASLAELSHNLRLEERAWQVIRNSADAMELAYREKREEQQKARYALEAAWDRYYNCPTCGVPFGDGDKDCRVCGTARPPAPPVPDPRHPSAS